MFMEGIQHQLGDFQLRVGKVIPNHTENMRGIVMEVNEEEKSLKYLEFVQVVVAVCLLSVHDYAKNNAGPLMLNVETVEGTLKTVSGPAYDKFHDFPIDVLKFVDRKVRNPLIILSCVYRVF